MRRPLTEILVATMAVASLGCGLRSAVLRLERSQLEQELGALRALDASLHSGFPPGSRHVELFVSFDVVNQILAAADRLQFPIPGIRNATLRFDEIRFMPQDDSPGLIVKASATKGSLTVAAAVDAYLLIEDAGQGQAPVLRVRVRKVAPVVKIWWVRLTHFVFLQRLATLKADELAVNKIAFPLPLEKAFVLEAPAVNATGRVNTPRNNGSWIEYRISRPAFSLPRTVHVDRYVFLRDGIHMFASIS